MATLPERARELIESGALAHLVTVNQDGSPQVPRITEGGAPELLQRLAHVYLGSDVVFPPMSDPPPGYVTHIAIDRVGGVGPWSD